MTTTLLPARESSRAMMPPDAPEPTITKSTVSLVLQGSELIRGETSERVREAARKLGYRGKSIIHPNQVEIVNRAFTPTQKELDYYKRVLEAFDAAVARGSAATTVDGKLVDYAMAAMAKRVLSWGEGLLK